MINLSKLLRKKDLTIKDKFYEYTSPEVYLAENINDYKINFQNLNPPWFKMYSYADIIVHNIRINSIDNLIENIYEGIVMISDETGKKLMYWEDKPNMFPAEETFKEAKQRQGFKDNDWIYTLQFKHVYGQNAPHVSYIRKNKFSNKKQEKSLSIKIEKLFPSSDLIVCPSF